MPTDRDRVEPGRDPSIAYDIGLARLELNGGRLEAALRRVDSILEREPRNVSALELQGRLRERLCWMADVLEPADRWLELRPSEAEARRLFNAHRRALNGDRALVLLGRFSEPRVCRELKRVEILVECRRFQEARAAAERLSVDPGLDAKGAMRLARLCLDAANASLAVAFTSRARELAPDDPDALLLSGTLALWAGDHDGACGLAARILDRDPNCKPALQLKGQCDLIAGRLPAAIGCLEAALDAANPSPQILVLLAQARRINGQTGVARTLLRKARSLEIDYLFALEANELLVVHSRWRLFSRFFGFVALGNRPQLLSDLSALGLLGSLREPKSKVTLASVVAVLEDALTLLSGNLSTTLTRRFAVPGGFECVRRGPDERTACVRVQAILLSRGFDAALAAYEQLLSEYGHSPLVYTYRGECLLWAGRYQEAQRDFEAALQCLPETRWAWAGLGASYLFSGDAKKALATFARGRSHVAPALVVPVYHGEALRRLGNWKPALAAFVSARTLQPERFSVYLNLAIVHAALGDADQVATNLSMLRRLLPGFYRALHYETGTDHANMTTDLARCREVLEHGCEMLRGNRSTSLATWFGADGRAYFQYAQETANAHETPKE